MYKKFSPKDMALPFFTVEYIPLETDPPIHYQS